MPDSGFKNLVIWDVPLRWDGKPWQPQNTGDNPAAFQRFGVGDTMGERLGGAGRSNLTQVLLRRAIGKYTGEGTGVRRMHLYWRDGDQQWFYVVEAGRELETSIEQQGIKPLSVEAKGFLFTFDEEAEIDEIRASTGSFLKRDRLRLASVYFTQQLSGDNSRLAYHCQIGLIGDSSVRGGEGGVNYLVR